MGMSVVLYRVAPVEDLDQLTDLENQMDKLKSVNLYKIHEDLGIIFMNNPDPYEDLNAIPYKTLYGNYVSKEVGYRIINGFIPSSEVEKLCNWMREHNIDSFEGFSKQYDSLSEESQQALEDIGADDKEGLYTGYVKPLVDFYFAALEDHNSVVLCGE